MRELSHHSSATSTNSQHKCTAQRHKRSWKYERDRTMIKSISFHFILEVRFTLESCVYNSLPYCLFMFALFCRFGWHTDSFCVGPFVLACIKNKWQKKKTKSTRINLYTSSSSLLHYNRKWTEDEWETKRNGSGCANANANGAGWAATMVMVVVVTVIVREMGRG